MQRRPSSTSRRQHRQYLNAIAYFAMGGFLVAGMAFSLLIEMAIYVAQGGKLHIGADILFAKFSSGELAIMSCDAGFIAVACMIVAAFTSIKAGL